MYMLICISVNSVMRRTHIHCTENNVSDVHVDDVEDGLQDAHHQQLEGVQLPDDDAEGDQDAGGGQTTLQHTAQGGRGCKDSL